MLINKFRGEYYYLSNFYYCHIIMDGKRYQSVEHAFQAAKTIDDEERKCVRHSRTPSEAKYFGRRVTLRSDWESVKVQIMHDLLLQKFSELSLRSKLLSTGDAEIVEGNTHNDTFWGVCNGIGQNQLGKLLMQVRDELKGV